MNGYPLVQPQYHYPYNAPLDPRLNYLEQILKDLTKKDKVQKKKTDISARILFY